MQAVSKAYKEQIRRVPYRNRSFMKVTIGLINQEAQKSAWVPDAEHYTYFSNLTRPLDNYDVPFLYAVGEQDFAATDGSMYFLPREGATDYINAGIVSKDLLGAAEIRFPVPYSIKGLTIDFGKAYPVDFRIESDNAAEDVVNNQATEFVTQLIMEDATFIRIIPSRMVNGAGRLRIHKITMGIGIYFDNKLIMSGNKSEYISPIMESLPTIDFDLAIDNKNRLYDIENRGSSVNFLEPGQKIQIEYGYEMDGGTVEWMPGGVLNLRTWEADDTKMKFIATDRFETMDQTYYRGAYSVQGISLYDLAVDVLTDAGIDSRTYWLDGYLKSVIVNNPMPPVSHREALQIIANAGRCILYQDRQGLIYMKSSFVPEMTADSATEEYYSNAAAILDRDNKDEYAQGSKDYAATDGSMYFLPRNEPFLHTGFISSAIADADGLFAQNPVVNISLEASFKCFGMVLEFGGNPPQEIHIHSLQEWELQETYVVTDIADITNINHEFPEFDMLMIEFVKGAPHNRVVLNYIGFGDRTDYWLKYQTELSKTPKGIQLQRVKSLEVSRIVYYPSAEETKEIAKADVTASDRERQFVFTWTDPAYDLAVNVGGIVYSSTYSAVVGVPNNGDYNIVVTGNIYTTSTLKYTKAINPTGTIESWENPLISSAVHAADIADWVAEYLAADREYDLAYRGDPRIDANDLLYLENKYTDNLMVRAYSHSLNFNGGALSGSIKARRVADVD